MIGGVPISIRRLLFIVRDDEANWWRTVRGVSSEKAASGIDIRIKNKGIESDTKFVFRFPCFVYLSKQSYLHS